VGRAVVEDRNKAIVRQYIEQVLNERHLELVDDLFAPELHEQVKRHAKDLHGAFPDAHEKIDTLISEGDIVAALWVLTGTHRGTFLGIPPTGRQVSILGMSFYHLRDGRIVDDTAVSNLLAGAKQLGASLLPPSDTVRG
jgi:steroid delta-isomerase-like uncharacterized protein